MRTTKLDLLPDSIVVVCERSIAWCRSHHADVWSTAQRTTAVKSFPPGLVVWADPLDEIVWLAAKVQFHALPQGSVMGPGGVPRPADAFFRALHVACSIGAKTVRVFGCEGWKGDERWKRNALARLWLAGQTAGVDVQRPGLHSLKLR